MDEPSEDARRLRVALGRAVREARLRAGLRNQDLLAERLGTTQQTISRYEKGELGTLDDVVAVENALRLDRGDLLVDAGYVRRDVDVLALIRADKTIDPAASEMLVDLYERSRERAAQEAG